MHRYGERLAHDLLIVEGECCSVCTDVIRAVEPSGTRLTLAVHLRGLRRPRHDVRVGLPVGDLEVVVTLAEREVGDLDLEAAGVAVADR